MAYIAGNNELHVRKLEQPLNDQLNQDSSDQPSEPIKLSTDKGRVTSLDVHDDQQLITVGYDEGLEVYKTGENTLSLTSKSAWE